MSVEMKTSMSEILETLEYTTEGTKDIGKDNQSYKLDELYKLINDITGSYPQSRIPLNVYMSKRPKFK